MQTEATTEAKPTGTLLTTGAAPGDTANQTGTTDTKPAAETQSADADKATQEAKTTEAAETKPADGEADKAPAADIALTLPEGVVPDEALLSDFKAFAKETGLKGEQAQKLVDSYVKARERDEATLAKQQAELSQAWLNEAKADKELGGQHFEKTARTSRLAVEKFASPKLKELLASTGFGNHPEMIRFCAQVGKALGEDSVAGATGAGATRGPSGDDALIDAIYTHPTSAKYKKE